MPRVIRCGGFIRSLWCLSFGGSSVRGAVGGSSKSQTELRKEAKGDGLAFLAETVR